MDNQPLANYKAASGEYDETLDPATGKARAHWRAMLDSLASEPADMMRQRFDAVQRQVHENGVTYNVYADAKGTQRAWDLNVLPLILPQDEWREIEAAVIQRATLLNKILGDVYGAQTMLEEGLLPPALVHGHAGFLRPSHAIPHSDDVALHFYAIDMARGPDGRWWALADRTQAPSGAGYALENRSIIGRMFPELMRELNVQPLNGFFSTMRDSLAHWGRLCATNGNVPLRNGEAPLIVLLTSGPYNETYYEQAYLARYLGLPLVEGGDLTVRNGIVWLKALSGLRRVHVIMRRVDDEFCDPLELRTDSALGVAGLTDAARRGNVLVANSLGSSLLESGALLGFLPALSKRFLGEPLKMPSVATWWCGQPAALEQVVERLDKLVIKPAFSQVRQETIFGQDLKGDARAAFIARLRAKPNNFVAQEVVRLSQAPVWQPGTSNQLCARSVGLRVYACATPNGYVVMPGGLTRVATGPDARVLTMQRGGGSKDTWIQSKSVPHDAHRPMRRSTTSEDLVRDDTNLSSRMAENMFWFGRHSERCDNIGRLLRVSLNILFDARSGDKGAEWPTVKALCAWFHLVDNKNPEPVPVQTQQQVQSEGEIQTQLQGPSEGQIATPQQGQAQPALSPSVPPTAAESEQSEVQSQSQSQSPGQTQSQAQSQGQTPSPEPAHISSDAEIEATLLLAVVSIDVPGLARQQQQLYRTASHLRERLSIDNWRALNQMEQRVAQSGRALSQSDAMTILDDASASLMTMAGFALDGMTRDLGWRFLSFGRRLERLQFQSVVLQSALGMDVDGNLDWLLELSDSIVTYRSRYRSQPEWLPVLDLLLLDASNPRSILFQIDGVMQSLRKIARSYGPCGEDQLLPLQQELLALDPETDLYIGSAHLIDLLRRINVASEALSEHIGLKFFSYTGDHQHRTKK
jgi:uncharacterized circularly permuted ATP-grasp superfamily protein/uncharacterized alpha-E superfamily protein